MLRAYRPRPPIRALLPTIIGVIALILVSGSFFIFPRLPYNVRAFLTREIPLTACNLHKHAAAATAAATCHASAGGRKIPNIVNIVYILKDEETSDYPLQFSHYLSLYAIYWRMKPDIIYLHTNTGPDCRAVRRARDGSMGKWSKLFFEIPGLTINQVTAPTQARNGANITIMEHRSDFVRVQAVHDFGGIYIDLDVHTLQGFKPLLDSGYGAVGGRQVDTNLNSGTFMSVKGGKMISTWLEAMHTVYDGKWTTHSNLALTRVAEGLLRSDPCEVLVMGEASFAPVGWTKEDNMWLFDDHEDETSNLEGFSEEKDSLRDFGIGNSQDDAHADPSWAHDWSCTFLLHAFNLKKPRHNVKSNGITPRYVLERRSNFARAVYPVAKHLYDRNVFTIDEE